MALQVGVGVLMAQWCQSDHDSRGVVLKAQWGQSDSDSTGVGP